MAPAPSSSSEQRARVIDGKAVAAEVTARVEAETLRFSEATGTPQPYRVQAGDTLWSIASEHYHGDPRQGVWVIQRENGLAGASLMPGQVLMLP